MPCRQLTLLLGLVSSVLAGCHSPLPKPRGGPTESHRAAGPRTPEEIRKAFVLGASHTLLRTYDDDRDDTAPILAALHQLGDDEALVPLKDTWHEPLALALGRCERLVQQSRRLRLLRQAFAKSYVDELTGILEGVDKQACQSAWQPREGDTPELMRMVVTIEPLGPQKFGTLKSLCRMRSRPPAPMLSPSEALPWGLLIPGAQRAPDEEP